MTRTTMRAAILFADPNNISKGLTALIANGFTVELVAYWADPTLWVKAKVRTSLDDDRFNELVRSIVNPCGGDIIEIETPYPSRLTPEGRRWAASIAATAKSREVQP